MTRQKMVKLGLFIALGWLAACNAITTADELSVAVIDDDHAATSSGSGTDSGNPSPPTTGTGGSGQGGNNDSNDPTDPPQALSLADGITITNIDLYQGVQRPLMSDGTPASSDVPVVAGRSALMRIFYATDNSYDGQTVTARLTIDTALPIEHKQTLSGTSSQSSLNSTINLEVPGEALSTGSQFRVELLQPTTSTDTKNDDAAYPPSGQTSLQVEQGGSKLKIMLVPVSYYGSLPDTSPEQLKRYQEWFEGTYPIPEVEINVRSSSYSFNGNLNNYYGWSELLDEISDLRSNDNAPSDVYYYGIHGADSSGLLGLGWVGKDDDDNWARTAIGVGWTGEAAPETAVHEIGHNHGRSHAPCGTSGDYNYPHSGASIGVWGYNPAKNKLLDPYDYVDFMSYCDPQWISDYTFKALFKRLKVVSASPKRYIPLKLQNRVYDRVKLIDGKASWGKATQRRFPPLGAKIKAKLFTQRAHKRSFNGHFYQYDHIDGGVLYLMRPLQRGMPQRIRKAHFAIGGKAYTLSRQ